MIYGLTTYDIWVCPQEWWDDMMQAQIYPDLIVDDYTFPMVFPVFHWPASGKSSPILGPSCKQCLMILMNSGWSKREQWLQQDACYCGATIKRCFDLGLGCLFNKYPAGLNIGAEAGLEVVRFPFLHMPVNIVSSMLNDDMRWKEQLAFLYSISSFAIGMDIHGHPLAQQGLSCSWLKLGRVRICTGQ